MLIHTGRLREVMSESIQAAITVVGSRSPALDLDSGFYHKHPVDIHVPEGAAFRNVERWSIIIGMPLIIDARKSPR